MQMSYPLWCTSISCNIPYLLLVPAVGSTLPALALVTMAGLAAGALALSRSPEAGCALSVLILPGLAAAGGSILLPASTLPISPLAVI
jgi:hypothetical protein